MFTVGFVTEKNHEEDDRLDEPLEEADAVACDATNEECEIGATAREGTATEAEVSLRAEIDEAFRPEAIRMAPSIFDGMPVPVNERGSLATAHPFTRETIVCLEDESEYVELFEDEAAERGWVRFDSSPWRPPMMTMQHGSNQPFVGKVAIRSRYSIDGTERERFRFDPAKVQTLWGVKLAPADPVDPLVDKAMLRPEGTVQAWVPVRAKRERCQNFMRQVMANDDVPNADEHGHFLRFYNCTARKSVGGAFMTLRDEAMYACDYRSPPDPFTVEKYIDKFDRERLDGKRHLEMVPLFNMG